MRNLVLLTQRVWPGVFPGRPVAVCFDPDRDATWGVTDTNVLIGWDGKDVVAEVQLQSTAELQDAAVCTGMQYVGEQQAVSFCFSTGELVLYHTENKDTEVVGCVEKGLMGLQWSPDTEVLLLLTGDNTFILMTKDFDVITEQKIQTSEFGEGKFINVGWGKKETQFHGSAGKAAALAKEERKTTALYDDSKPRSSWRGDGKFFVVGSMDVIEGVEGVTKVRKLRVYSREGVLQSTSEWVGGLEHALHWKPSGSLIASSERLPHRHDIVFFEKNGLRHGEFTLPFAQNEVFVKELQWNSDSSVLAVWVEGMGDRPLSCLQLWTVNNYHWYLKQEYRFGPSSGALGGFGWHPEDPHQLAVVTMDGSVANYTYCTDVCVSSGPSSTNPSTVGVIDGQTLLLTPFRLANVPPPMSLTQLKAPGSVQCLSIGSHIAILTEGHLLSLYKQENPRLAPTLVAEKIPLGDLASCEVFRHLEWCGESVLLAVRTDPMTDRDQIWQFTLSGLNTPTPSVTSSHVTTDNHVLRVRVGLECSAVCVQMVDGSLVRCVPGAGGEAPTLTPWDAHTDGNGPCNWMAVTSADGVEIAVCLSSKFRLYANGRQIADDCTSFTLHDEHIIYVTLSSTVCFMALRDLSKSLSGSAPLPKPKGLLERKVERGSTIVTAVRGDVKLVLQMPRGNLETIAPRPLVLSDVCHDLDDRSWMSAFLKARKHRLDLNILYDHNPTQFESDVGGFLSALGSPKYINLFLSDLRDVDVMKSLYSVDANVQPGTAGAVQDVPVAGKIDRVCEFVKDTLTAMHKDDNNNEYLLSVIMAYARKTGDDALEHALEYVRQLRDTHGGDEIVSADEALTFLCFLADVDRLYNVALGMYDFDLVLMVAEKSQKDPKEYLPILESLSAMPTYVQRHNIDRHLNRHSKALMNLSKAGPEHVDTCMAYMRDKELYKDALSIFSQHPETLKNVRLLYGDYLVANKQYTEGSLMYELGGHFEKALEASKRAHDWRQTFILASQMNLDQRQVALLATEVAEGLRSQGQWVDAARVLLDYAQNSEDAIALLVNGSQWAEALRLIHDCKRPDMIETNLIPGLEEVWESTVAGLKESMETFAKRTARLQVVRETKARRAQMLLEGYGEDVGDVGDADLFSDTSSIASHRTGSSRSSNKTRSSNRSRKRTEKKKRSLREGGEFEEEALMDAQGETVVKTRAMEQDVHALLHMLARFGMTRQAGELQQIYSATLSLLESSHKAIWPPAKPPTEVVEGAPPEPEVVVAAPPPAPLQREALSRWMLKHV